jgi:hypothetical protein
MRVTSTTPHGLTTGDEVDCTPNITWRNGEPVKGCFIVTRVDGCSFEVRSMTRWERVRSRVNAVWRAVVRCWWIVMNFTFDLLERLFNDYPRRAARAESQNTVARELPLMYKSLTIYLVYARTRLDEQSINIRLQTNNETLR